VSTALALSQPPLFIPIFLMGTASSISLSREILLNQA
jgi:hypothetical protein